MKLSPQVKGQSGFGVGLDLAGDHDSFPAVHGNSSDGGNHPVQPITDESGLRLTLRRLRRELLRDRPSALYSLFEIA